MKKCYTGKQIISNNIFVLKKETFVFINCSLVNHVQVEETTEYQKKQVYYYKVSSECENIFLGVLHSLDADIFLHHFLIHPRHRNGNHRTADDIF